MPKTVNDRYPRLLPIISYKLQTNCLASSEIFYQLSVIIATLSYYALAVSFYVHVCLSVC